MARRRVAVADQVDADDVDQDDDDQADADDVDQDDDDQADADDVDQDDDGGRRRRRDLSWARPGPAVEQGAGFILAVVFWAWVGLPFLQGGPGRVKDTLRAKFINQDSKGHWLP